MPSDLVYGVERTRTADFLLAKRSGLSAVLSCITLDTDERKRRSYLLSCTLTRSASTKTAHRPFVERRPGTRPDSSARAYMFGS